MPDIPILGDAGGEETPFSDLLNRLVAMDDARVGYTPPTTDPARTIKVAWLCARNPFQGGEYYRATRPAALSSAKFGWHTAVAFQVGDVPDNPRVHVQTPNGFSMDPDVLILRPIGKASEESSWSMESLVEKAQKAGQYVIADLDDDIWAHEDWPEDDRPNDDHYEDWCWKVDAFLVSTEHLKRTVQRHAKVECAKLGREQVHVYVAPNCFDPFGMSQGSGPVPGSRFGTRAWLHGRMTPDLEMYRELVGSFLQAPNSGSWVHIGADEKSDPTKPGAGSHGISSFAELGFPRERLLEIPSTDLRMLGRVLKVAISVGVFCVAEHPYNEAKTLTQPFELAAAGLPLMAISGLELYREVPGWTAPYSSTILKRIDTLYSDEAWLRESKAAQEWAADLAKRSERDYLGTIRGVVTKLMHLSAVPT